MTFWDKILFAFLIGISAFGLLFQGLCSPDTQCNKVKISIDGELYGLYEFSDRTQKIDIKTRFGENIVKIDKTGVWVDEASCKDKLDIKVGKINKAGQVIVCLPNRLMIELQNSERKVDGVTY